MSSKNIRSLPALVSDDEEVYVPSKKSRQPLPVITPPPTMLSKKRKQQITPATHRQYSSHELFGTDSEEEEVDVGNGNNRGNHFFSYFTVKCLKAFSRQIRQFNPAKYYVVLKIYDRAVLELSTENQNKLSHAEIVIRNRTNCDTDAWYFLTKFIEATRRDIKHCFVFNHLRDKRPLTKTINSTEQPQRVEKPAPSTPHEEYEPIKKSRRGVVCAHASDPRPSTSTMAPRKSSARDVFGSDSDDDNLAEKPAAGKKPPSIFSYFNKRIANGVARQSDTGKQGSHFVELKVYDCEEIKNIQPMNRWRHAIITVKNRTNDDTEAWGHLTEFIKATRKEFKDCRPDIINGC